MSLFGLLALGFALGVKHATDADHVVAVSTIVTRERSMRIASMVGVLWGFGHTLTLLVVGGVMVLFDSVLPPRVGLGLELLVAVMLVALGAANLRGIGRARKGRPDDAAPPLALPPALPVPPAGRSAPPNPRPGRRALRPLAIGVVHGLSGSAAVALLVLTQIRERATAMLCLGLFGLGTVAGMVVITSLMAVPMLLVARRARGLERHAGWLSGMLSIGVGALMVYQIGFADGLFMAAPRWSPR